MWGHQNQLACFSDSVLDGLIRSVTIYDILCHAYMVTSSHPFYGGGVIMLTRRNLFKSAVTFGLSALAPWLDRPALSAVAKVRQGCEPAGDDPPPELQSHLLEMEYLENLKDDLDCAEVVAFFSPSLKRGARTDTDSLRKTRHCPFCGEVGLHVGPESFRCKWCEAEGSAIEFHARVHGISHEEAAARLDGLLNDGTLRGRRCENEHASRMLVEAQGFYQELLREKPEGAIARQCLAEQGVTQSTIERFRLGYAPPEPDDLLSRHLIAAGYVVPKLLQTLHVNEDGEEKMVDRYGGGNLLTPICDSEGRSWGFMKKPITSPQSSLSVGWTEDTLSVSERRLRRLIFPHPVWPEDFNRHQRLLIAETPWEVVALHNAGIGNAVYLFDSATDPVRLRTLLSVGRNFVCAFDTKGYRAVTAFRVVERLKRETRRLFVMEVPSRGGLLALLQSGGRQAVQDSMTQAIPFHQWMGE